MGKTTIVAKEIEWEFVCVGCQYRKDFPNTEFMEEIEDGYDPIAADFVVKPHAVEADAKAIGCFLYGQLVGFIPKDKQDEFWDFMEMFSAGEMVNTPCVAIMNRTVVWSLADHPRMLKEKVQWFPFVGKVILEGTEEWFAGYGF